MMPSLLSKATQAAKNLKAPSIHSPVTLDEVSSKLGLASLTAAFSGGKAKEHAAGENRYCSSAPIYEGNNVKFHVDGCAYFWAASEAMLTAKEPVWILGWWVSPEVYLRRPPSENEQYRLDRMLLAAAERGVKANVVVFKEIPQVMYLSSKHTKRALEALHPSISVFRYPDHIQDAQGVLSSTKSLLHGITAAGTAGLGKKLVIIDQHLVFIGGIDLSYGRWDTIQHPITDAHPGNVDDIVFPGQHYNNARVMDFKNLDNWEHNKLSRLTTSRMGWQDISVSLTGPVVADICHHFVERWNFIHSLKYNADLPGMRNYEPLPPTKAPCAGARQTGSVSCQLVRSIPHWSSGIATENGIYNAYIDIIEKSEHFVYLEQQFFITASGHWLAAVWNRVGEAIIIVVMPAVPAFPGDLQALITGHPPRAIMKLQYKSISRGGFSILDKLKQAGVNPEEYIRFFNLRSYDRINESGALQHAEAVSHVDYNAASQEHDDIVDPFATNITSDYQAYRGYQKASSGHSDWDTVSSCYMLGGEDIRKVPWPAGCSVPEIDAFVSEELYVHSKVLISDDRVMICGSANLNDRSFKGSRDSEIALPYKASKFAATLRRYLYRKHLGFLRPQEDKLVADPLSDNFLGHWNQVAHQNTLAFREVFAPMPDDTAKTWLQYQSLFWKRFMGPDGLHMAQWGHVQKSNFAIGEEGARQVKEELSKVRGTLVEMPLEFLVNTDIQIEDPGYNIITRQGYV
ncbi:hypothetical protein BDV12DRAFT_208212 [Aspergillus spectabilis]